MSLICSLSGEPCVDAVVTPSGHVYERRVIEKHIQATGTDPISKEPLSVSNLISIKGARKSEEYLLIAFSLIFNYPTHLYWSKIYFHFT